MMAAFGVLQYAAAVPALPYRDAWFAAADRMLGIDWPALHAWTWAHRSVAEILTLAYPLLLLQLLPALVVLAFLDSNALRRFLAANFVVMMVTIACSVVLPAAGAMAWFHPALTPITPDSYPAQLELVRGGALRVIDPDHEVGLIQFPSIPRRPCRSDRIGILAHALVDRSGGVVGRGFDRRVRARNGRSPRHRCAGGRRAGDCGAISRRTLRRREPAAPDLDAAPCVEPSLKRLGQHARPATLTHRPASVGQQALPSAWFGARPCGAAPAGDSACDSSSPKCWKISISGRHYSSIAQAARDAGPPAAPTPHPFNSQSDRRRLCRQSIKAVADPVRSALSTGYSYPERIPGPVSDAEPNHRHKPILRPYSRAATRRLSSTGEPRRRTENVKESKTCPFRRGLRAAPRRRHRADTNGSIVTGISHPG